MLENRASIESTDAAGWNALFYASSGGYVSICRYLLRGEALDPLHPDDRGFNMLDYAKDLETRNELEEILRRNGVPVPKVKAMASLRLLGGVPSRLVWTAQLKSYNVT